MSRALFAVVLAFPLIALANPHYGPDVEVNVPPEVVSSGGSQRSPVLSAAFIRIKIILKGR